MPQRVEVKGLGIVEFPDGTPPSVIKAAIRKAITPKTVSEQLKLLPTVGEMIKTRLEGNYGIPTNAVISPRKQDYTSQPTISPGPRDYTKDPLAQSAINMAAGFAMPTRRLSPEASKLVAAGAQVVASTEGRGAFYLDRLGNWLKLAKDDHAEALIRAGLATEDNAASPAVLRQLGLIRVRTLGDNPRLAMMIAHQPTSEQRAALELAHYGAPGEQVGSVADFIGQGWQKHISANVEEFMNALKKGRW